MTNMTEDYLKVDEPIPGQKYVCVSFAEPQDSDLLQDREAFFATRFLKAFCEEYKQATEYLSQGGASNPTIEEKTDMSYENIKNRYDDFKRITLGKLQTEFESLEEKNERMTMAGFKVRGAFSSMGAAQAHAKNVKSTEPAFHVFVTQMGYWVPVMPQNVEDIKEQHYDENKLNELVKHQTDDEYKRKLQYENRKLDMLHKQNEETKIKKTKLATIKESENEDEVEEEHEDILEILDSDSDDESEDNVSEPEPIVEEKKVEEPVVEKKTTKKTTKRQSRHRRRAGNRRRNNRRN